MRNALFTTAILFCLATASMAAEKKDAQTQSKQTQHTDAAYNDAGGTSTDYACSQKSDCMPKPGRQSDNLQNDPEGDPQASQNQVEYGGAG